MIDTKNHILKALLAGDRKSSSQQVSELLESGLSVKDIYEYHLKPALVQVGELWEENKISVATEHLASAIVESLLNEIYVNISPSDKTNKTVVVTCLENEHHQIGARMVSDIFELHGWEVLFLGANTPKQDLVNYLKMMKPNLVAISLSIYFHLPTLEETIRLIRNESQELEILTGGQAFTRGGKEILQKYDNITYLPDLDAIEEYLKNYKE
ncbi:MAG TPA: cobalamin-dependent protein [Tangfeifania sp.]|nr:cobalamin-dependent protein [Tangfeifania sp.]